MRITRYTPEKINEITQYIKNNPSHVLSQIALHFGISTPSLAEAIKKYNIPYEKRRAGNKTGNRTYKSFAIKKFCEVHPEKTTLEIAQEFSVSRTYIYYLKKIWGKK